MNTTAEQGVALAQSVARFIGTLETVETILCPPFVSIPMIANVLQNTRIKLGAQNMNENSEGALTGEVSANMLRDFASHVILGHSERRTNYRETNEVVAQKIDLACDRGLIPILCIGEDAEQRQNGRAERFIRQQLRQSLGNPENISSTVIAYEPIWAIGTGISASIEQIEYIAASIREEIAHLSDEEHAQRVRILYGGSAGPDNIHEVAGSSYVDGALVGGASLNAEAFVYMAHALAKAAKI